MMFLMFRKKQFKVLSLNSIVMSGTYKQNKLSIYNWNAKNYERNREINKACVNRYRAKKMAWKNIIKVFNSILLE